MNELQQEMVMKNIGLAGHLAKYYTDSGIEYEDLVSVGKIGLIKATETFDANRGIKFSTYASHCILNEIRMELRKQKHLRREISLETVICVDEEGNELHAADILPAPPDPDMYRIERDAWIEQARAAAAQLPQKQKELFLIRYGSNDQIIPTQVEVARRMNLSQSMISRLEKAMRLQLREKLMDVI